jgi:hypothetical protein
MAQPRDYRVIYRDGERLRTLGRISEVRPSWRTLDPFHNRLILEGAKGGELLLVNEAPGIAIAQRELRPPHRD